MSVATDFPERDGMVAVLGGDRDGVIGSPYGGERESIISSGRLVFPRAFRLLFSSYSGHPR